MKEKGLFGAQSSHDHHSGEAASRQAGKCEGRQKLRTYILIHNPEVEKGLCEWSESFQTSAPAHSDIPPLTRLIASPNPHKQIQKLGIAASKHMSHGEHSHSNHHKFQTFVITTIIMLYGFSTLSCVSFNRFNSQFEGVKRTLLISFGEK